MKSILLLTLAVVGLQYQGWTQHRPGDTVLRGATIEVIQSYKPEVKQVPKPEFTPQLPPRDTSRPDVTYEVPQQTLYFTYSALPIRPLALGKDSLDVPFQNYVKLGGGNLSTVYLDAGLASFRGTGYETALHLHHLSQSGNISNQKISLSGFEAQGTADWNDHKWQASLNGLHNRYHYYGYDHGVYEYPKDAVRQTFTGFEAGLEARNKTANRYGINYSPSLRASLYNDEAGLSETTLAFGVPVSREITEELTGSMGIHGTFTRLSGRGAAIGNSIFQITPLLQLQRENLQARFGFYPTFGAGSKTYFLPDISLRFQLPGTQFALTAGWEGRLRQNTYKQLTQYNPYLSPMYRAGVQTRTDELFGMLQSNIGDHITLTGKISWLQFNNLPLFLNDTGDHKNFYILYDEKVNAVALEGAVRYGVANNFSLGVSAAYYNYYQSSHTRVWHEPGLRVTSDFTYKPVKSLTITAYATILDQIYALNQSQLPVKLDGIFDIGGGVEYSFIPRLSAFLNVNNLLNNEYHRWYRYQSFGLNVFGGVRFKF